MEAVARVAQLETSGMATSSHETGHRHWEAEETEEVVPTAKSLPSGGAQPLPGPESTMGSLSHAPQSHQLPLGWNSSRGQRL